MKRTLLILTVLILFAVSTGIACHTVDTAKNNVVFTEKLLSGDLAHLEELTVSVNASYGSTLYWKISHDIGKAPHTVTDFSLFQTSEEEEYGYAAAQNFSLSVACRPYLSHPFIGESSFRLFFTSEPSFQPLREEFEALYVQSQNGIETEKTVRLSDYYDYYPVGVNFSYPGQYRKQRDQQINAFREKLNAYFRIPVLDTEARILSVTQEDAGTSRLNARASGSYFEFMTKTVFTEDACYFVFDNRVSARDAVRVDTSLIPGGYGIYKIPLTESFFDTDGLETVFSLRERTDIRTFELSEDKKHLYLVCDEDGVGMLKVIDIETMSVVYQRETDTSLFYSIYSGDRYILLQLKNRCQLIVEEDGVYRDAFSFEYPYAHQLDRAAILCRNGKLIIADLLRLHSYAPDAVGFSVAIYDSSGLLCHAEYDCNLDHPYAENELIANPRPLSIHIEP